MPQVDFADLAGYSDILVFMRNVTCSAAEQRLMQMSVDNGATFFGTSGDYVSIGADGVETGAGFIGFALHDTGAAAARSAVVRIPGMNVPGVPKLAERITRTTASPLIFTGSLLAVNALRFKPQTSGNFTGGTIQLLGRKTL